MLYGMGVLQTWIYFVGHPTDPVSVKWTLQLLAAYWIYSIFPRSLFNCDVFHLHHHACSFVPDILRAASTNSSPTFMHFTVAGMAQTVVSWAMEEEKERRVRRRWGNAVVIVV
ncbi:hypothetical protein B0H10DRAFT_1959881 [Mycena sp. CBHHK59/15]|nr:hypothetical protein B0H10DRAFT_1959881 [Mycena sp. CBHHK59/15]